MWSIVKHFRGYKTFPKFFQSVMPDLRRQLPSKLSSDGILRQGLNPGVPVVAQRKWIWLVSMRMKFRSLALLSGLKIWHSRELSYRSQRWLASGVAVALAWASSYSCNLTPSLGTSIHHRFVPKKTKKKKKKIWTQPATENETWIWVQIFYLGSLRNAHHYGVPWWLSGLRIWCYHCCGTSSIPDQELPYVLGMPPTPPKKEVISGNTGNGVGNWYRERKWGNKVYIIKLPLWATVA